MPDASSDAGSPTALRLKLKMAGFSPIPTRGKIPPIPEWQTKANATAEEIATWMRDFPDAVNTSLLTAQMPTIDIDITDTAVADAVERIVTGRYGSRGRILVRFGSEPKRAIPMRCDVPFRKMVRNFVAPDGVMHKIEILADGQQVVVDGIHPDIGKRYRWRDATPADVGRATLPEMTRMDATVLLAELGLELTRSFGYDLRREKEEELKFEEVVPDWQTLLNNLYHGTELHDTIRDLAAKLIVAGTGEGATVNILRGLVEAAPLERDRRWHDRYTDIPRAVRGAIEMYERVVQERERTPRDLIDYSTWVNLPVPNQQWAIDDRLPLGEVALFSGEGATGKSIIQLDLCVCHVLGHPWLGASVRQGPALFFDAEDSEDVLHRRLAAILRHHNAWFDDVLGKLHLWSLSDCDAVLATVSRRNGKIEPTPLYRRMCEMAGDLKPVIIGIASAADVFAGSEIDRSQVRQFIALMNHLPRLSGGSLVLISHPSIVGTQSGTGISGSTAWHNSVRARFYLKAVAAREGEEDRGLRELEFKKNNYGSLNATVTLQWNSGMFMPIETGEFDAAVREAKVEEVYLTVFRLLIGQGQYLNAYPSARYAPRVIADHQQSGGITQRDFAAAQQRLFDRGVLEIVEQGPPAKRVSRLMERIS